MRLLLATMLLLFQNYPSQTQSHHIQDSPQNNIGNRERILAVSGIVWRSYEESTAHAGEYGTEYDPQYDCLYRAYLWATIIGVVGGFLGVGILIWQTILTRRSANAARDAANAARSSAEATVNSERAWIIAMPTVLNPDLHTLVMGDVQQRNVFVVSFVNVGKTPARLVETSMSYVTVNGPIENLPKEPEYATRSSHEGLILAPNATKENSFGAVAPLQPNSILTPQDHEALMEHRSFLFASGFVNYRDVHGELRETRFAYVYWIPRGGDILPRGFRHAGHPAYNRAT
jgi:hypothetical protein